MNMRIPQKQLQNRISKRQQYATINKSMLNKLNPPNLYRFFCLSLYRNEYYNVRLRISDIAKVTGEDEEALKNFNKDMDKILTRKKYPIPINHPVYEFTMRSLYKIPVMEESNYITLSYLLIKLDLSVKVKGYYIKLLLIAEDSIIPLKPKDLAEKLGMGKKAIEDYNIDLYNAGLLKYLSKGFRLTPNELLLDNDIAVQRKEWLAISGDPLPNICLLYTSPSPRDRG